MVMDSRIQDIYSLMGEFNPNQLISTDKLVNPNNQDQFLNIPNENSLNSSPEEHSPEDSEIFSDIALSYISKMLDEDDGIDNFQEFSALEATEKPFYEILGKKYPPSPSPVLYPSSNLNVTSETPDSISPHFVSSNSFSSSSSRSNSGQVENNWPFEYWGYQLPVEFANQSSFSSKNSFSSTLDGSGDELDGVANLFLESLPAWNFQTGVEEADKFLPNQDKLVIDLEANGSLLSLEPKEESKLVEIKPEEEEKKNLHLSKGRKNPHNDDLSLEEGRSVKQSAVSSVSSEEFRRTEMFDDVLLCNGEVFPKGINELREALQHLAISKSSLNGPFKGSNSRRGRGKKQLKKEVVDLRTLLLHCAQMVAANDQKGTNELLRQIRQHSSPTGDGTQRLAFYFANGIEARLAGTGSTIYNSFLELCRNATDLLTAYKLYLAATPFKKISYFFSNRAILNASAKAKRVHVIEFGMNFGFQWPSLIERMANREGGPPKLRITGIDFPQPGLRPAERIEATGRRLADYAQSFSVPFEYRAIASKWEDVRVKDLNIDRDEVLIVNCMYMLKHLPDESVVVESPRDVVLNTIRKMNPDVFIHGIVNGSYGAPFFVTRFREALYRFSSLYDILDTIIPREDEERLLIEREILGREAINVIACEGLERRERPETYKQWSVRNLRAGFTQQPLNQHLLKTARDKVKAYYHKDFNVDEDSQWLLQGWKGRIIYALSTWKPNNLS